MGGLVRVWSVIRVRRIEAGLGRGRGGKGCV